MRSYVVEQATKHHTVWFDVADDDAGDVEKGCASPTLRVRPRRKRRMQEIHDQVSNLDKIPDQTKQSLFLVLADECLPKVETQSISSIDSSIATEDTPVHYPIVDNDADSALQNLSDKDLIFQIDSMALEQRSKKCPVSSQINKKPIKRFKEQDATPQSIVVQADALKKAMDRRKSKKIFFPSIWS